MCTTEDILLNELRKGTEKGFRTLFELYYDPLFCVALQYLHDEYIAEVIVGDLFFLMWEKRQSLIIKGSLMSYLLKSVRNLSLNYLKKAHVRKEVGLELATHLTIQIEDNYPLDILLNKELEEVIQEEIKKLPFETYRVFVLSRRDNLEYKEIASQLNISLNTVKYHIKRAIFLLREGLKDYLN